MSIPSYYMQGSTFYYESNEVLPKEKMPQRSFLSDPNEYHVDLFGEEETPCLPQPPTKTERKIDVFYMFCGHKGCRKRHTIEIQSFRSEEDGLYTLTPESHQDPYYPLLLRNSYNVSYVCPHCNQESSLDPCHGTMATKFHKFTYEFDYKKAYLNAHGFLFTFKGYHMQVVPYMTRISFNLRTGMTTLMQPIGPKGKPIKEFATNRLQNITHYFYGRQDLNVRLNDVSIDTMLEFIYKLNDHFAKYDRFNRRPFDPSILFEESEAIHYTFNFNMQKDPGPNRQRISYSSMLHILKGLTHSLRYPDFTAELAEYFIQAKTSLDIKKNIVSYQSTNQLKDLMHHFKIPNTKLARKALLTGSFSLSYISFLYQTFTFEDTIRRIIENKKEGLRLVSFLFSSVRSTFDSPNLFDNLFMEIKKGYRESILKESSHNQYTLSEEELEKRVEMALVDLLMSKDIVDYRDAIRQIDYLKSYNIHMEFDIFGDWKRQHDLITLEAKRIRQVNLEIPYSEEELRMEETIDGYTFTIPRMTHDVVEIGHEMNHCVGSYTDSIVQKNCLIVLVSSEEEPYESCIEIRSSEDSVQEGVLTIYQAKAHDNRSSSFEASRAIRKWASKHAIQISTHDLVESPDDNYTIAPFLAM